jgi:DNA-binding IclR family transcriptional regulator
VLAVEHASRLLFTLAGAPGGEASLAELAKQTGIGRRRAAAILDTLRQARLVSRDQWTKNYVLGTGVMLLARAMLNSTDLAAAAAPYLEDLAAKTECSIHLGVISGDSLLVVARGTPPGGGWLHLNVWSRSPLTWGAHGLAYLAALPLDEFERRLAEMSAGGPDGTTSRAVDIERVRAQVEECRRLGYAESRETAGSGQGAMSAAFMVSPLDIHGSPRVGGCIVALGAPPPERVPEVGRLLVEAAREIGCDLAPWLQAGIRLRASWE